MSFIQIEVLQHLWIYSLWGRIDYGNKILTSIPVVNHDPGNYYYGATFITLGQILLLGRYSKFE
jgi:hypothetical protein